MLAAALSLLFVSAAFADHFTRTPAFTRGINTRLLLCESSVSLPVCMIRVYSLLDAWLLAPLPPPTTDVPLCSRGIWASFFFFFFGRLCLWFVFLLLPVVGRCAGGGAGATMAGVTVETKHTFKRYIRIHVGRERRGKQQCVMRLM